MCIICAGEAASSRPPGALLSAGAGRSAPHLTLDEVWRDEANTMIARYPSIDIHAHPGRFFLRQSAEATAFERRYGAPFVEQSLADMKAGALSAVFFATVADRAILTMGQHGITSARTYDDGEAFEDHKAQLDQLNAVCRAHSLPVATSVQDIEDAFSAQRTACVKSVEGGDFIEDDLSRVREAAESGIRLITAVHYNVNQIGDIQTEAPVHGGLTALGRDIIHAMQCEGIIVDLSHASRQTARDICAAARAPVVMSHAFLAAGADSHPRAVTLGDAKRVTETGGLIGLVPMGVTFAHPVDYVAGILDAVDRLGADHVAIGTDMDFTYRPVFDSYAEWPMLIGALLAGGLSQADCAKVMGGNMLRVLRQARAQQRV